MKSSLIIFALLAFVCATLMIHTSTAQQQQPTLSQKPDQVQQLVRSVNSTLALSTPTKKQSKVRFLRQILKNLRELGLLKNASEQAPYNEKDAKITLEKITVIVNHLLQLKKDGKNDDLKNYINDLKKSKNFREAVRLVRRILRRFLRRKVRKLANKIRTLAKLVQQPSSTAVTSSQTTPAVKNDKKLKRRFDRRFPIEKFLKRLEKNLKKVRSVRNISAIWKNRFPKRFPKRNTRSFALRRFPRAERRQPKRQDKKRHFPRRRFSTLPREKFDFIARLARRLQRRRAQQRRQAPRRFPKRFPIRLPRFTRRVVRRIPQRRQAPRRLPRNRRPEKPLFYVHRQLLKDVLTSYLRRKQNKKPARA
ncbi:hypothetical protein FDP41_010334 [Naegleria fowleri]|uniref:Uncharacterized protein n=1 Tax=Naegleria fowleri TaxID=5763 RepID=A0A6A5CD93_NAEFO|nr:uncharacterized protein FDP41_010334 [Naegleria fowleri]KAF0983269.1 hypothetical protein FDP41_010334 [Naegleria fowleri]